MFLYKISFSSSSNARLLFSVLKEKRRYIQQQPMGDVLQKRYSFFVISGCCGHSLTCFIRKGYSHRRLLCSENILPEIRTDSFFKELRCSCAINKFRTGTLCRILNYSTDHLKVPGNYRQLFVKIGKKSVIFSGSKQIPQMNIMLSQEICNSLPEYLNLPAILSGCFEFVLQIILQNTSISHAKRHIFKEHLILSMCPDFVLSRAPQIPWQKHTSEHRFYRTAPSGCF